MTAYHGSCHCGAAAFHFEGQIESALACNCSMCARRASLLCFVPRSSLHLDTPERDLGTYLFNKHVIKHRFCPQCGIHVYGEATDPKGNPVAAINLRCVDDVDLAAIPVHQYDGRSL